MWKTFGSAVMIVVAFNFIQYQPSRLGVAATPQKALVTSMHIDEATALLATNPLIAAEIQFTEEQRLQLGELLRWTPTSLSLSWLDVRKEKVETPSVALEIESQKAKHEAMVARFFSPQQIVRLRQIAIQIEVAKLGFHESLSRGMLGTEIGLSDGELVAIHEKTKEIQSDLELAIEKLVAAAYEDVFLELTPEQQEKGRKAIGKAFDLKRLDFAK